MPQPTTRDVHIDTALSNISIAYRNAGYVADLIFPVVPVDKQTDYYYKWTKDFWFRNHVDRRGPGGAYPEGGMQLSSEQYSCLNKALGFPLPVETVANQDAAVDLETAGAEWLADQFALDREIALAAKIMNASSSAWASSTTLSGTSQWSDYENSDPVSDITTGVQTLQKATGVKPNVALMEQEVWDKVKRHPDLLELYKYTTTAVLTREQVALAIDVSQIIVAGAVYNSANEGQTFVGAYIWPKSCLLMYVAPRPGLLVPSAGYTFVWNQNGYTIAIERVEERLKKRDVLLADHAFDQKITATDLGYEIMAAVA